MDPVDILAVGGHIGDCEIACGMALAAHVRQGKRVAMLHMTLGEKGHPSLAREAYAAQKRHEAELAASVYGAEVFVLEYGDGELPVSDDVKLQVCDVIRTCRPTAILTHWHGSMHKDHTNTALNVPDARFYAAIKGFERTDPPHWAGRLYFAENWEDRDGFVPEVFLEITEDDLDLWQRAAETHALFRGGVSSFPYVEYYRHLARLRGCEIGVPYATAFAVPPAARRRKVTTLTS